MDRELIVAHSGGNFLQNVFSSCKLSSFGLNQNFLEEKKNTQTQVGDL